MTSLAIMVKGQQRVIPVSSTLTILSGEMSFKDFYTCMEGHLLPQGQYLNNFGSGPSDDLIF